jgi:hypothetical protein
MRSDIKEVKVYLSQVIIFAQDESAKIWNQNLGPGILERLFDRMKQGSYRKQEKRIHSR